MTDQTGGQSNHQWLAASRKIRGVEERETDTLERTTWRAIVLERTREGRLSQSNTDWNSKGRHGGPLSLKGRERAGSASRILIGTLKDDVSGGPLSLKGRERAGSASRILIGTLSKATGETFLRLRRSGMHNYELSERIDTILN